MVAQTVMSADRTTNAIARKGRYDFRAALPQSIAMPRIVLKTAPWGTGNRKKSAPMSEGTTNRMT